MDPLSSLVWHLPLCEVTSFLVFFLHCYCTSCFVATTPKKKRFNVRCQSGVRMDGKNKGDESFVWTDLLGVRLRSLRERRNRCSVTMVYGKYSRNHLWFGTQWWPTTFESSVEGTSDDRESRNRDGFQPIPLLEGPYHSTQESCVFPSDRTGVLWRCRRSLGTVRS